MTSDTKLLPLPELPVAVERFVLSSLGPMKREGAVTALRTMLREYARANVAHATAAQDAEIERLRAKASEHRDGRPAALERAERLRTGTVGRCCGEETREPVRAPSDDRPLTTQNWSD